MITNRFFAKTAVLIVGLVLFGSLAIAILHTLLNHTNLDSIFWLKLGIATTSFLVIGLIVAWVWTRQVTLPFTTLSQTIEKMDTAPVNPGPGLKESGDFFDLADSLKAMAARNVSQSKELQDRITELEDLHQRTRTLCQIVKDLGSEQSLAGIGMSLISNLKGILLCRNMALVVVAPNRDQLFVLTESDVVIEKDLELIEKTRAVLEKIDGVTFCDNDTFSSAPLPEELLSGEKQAVFPLLHENRSIGALISSCPGDCPCINEEIELTGMVLNQVSGSIMRALLQDEKIRRRDDRHTTASEFYGMIGKDPKMQVIYKLIEDVGPTDAMVLIQGESGTGKELVSTAIHENSHRKDGPFIVVNCSAYPATLLESELFGHEKGAFTGAIKQRLGRFEQADGGTVFLDEIGEIPPSAQIRLLRVLQTQKFERLGGEKTISVNIRILAATNKDLLSEVQQGNFREDLYYRLSVIPITMPPLRQRHNDIPMLTRHFLKKYTDQQGKKITGISTEAMRMLMDYSWPGNVRELENCIEHSVVLAKGEFIEALDFPEPLLSGGAALKSQSPQTIAQLELKMLNDILDECHWNKKLAAERLGISRSTLYAKLKKYKISDPMVH